MDKTIGFIGLGMMGKPMAQRLINAGYELVVYNRTKEKATELIRQGASWAENPKSVAEQTSLIISMISTPDVLKEITNGEKGILAGLAKGKTHVDMSTVSPSVIDELTENYRKKKINFMHAPVLGSIPNVVEGSLLIFAGGDKEIYSQNKNVFKALGKRVWHFPKPNQATHLKLACNLFIANMIVTLSQGLLFVQKADLKPDVLLEVLGESTLNAVVYQFKGGTILEENFVPRFMVEHILKDVKLIIEAGENNNINLPTMKVIKELFDRAVADGYGSEDYSAVFKIIRDLK